MFSRTRTDRVGREELRELADDLRPHGEVYENEQQWVAHAVNVRECAARWGSYAGVRGGRW